MALRNADAELTPGSDRTWSDRTRAQGTYAYRTYARRTNHSPDADGTYRPDDRAGDTGTWRTKTRSAEIADIKGVVPPASRRADRRRGWWVLRVTDGRKQDCRQNGGDADQNLHSKQISRATLLRMGNKVISPRNP